MGHTAFLETCYNRIRDVKTVYEVFGFIKDICSKFQYERFSVISMPDGIDTHLEPHIIISNWPQELLKSYDKNELLKNSPVVEAIKTSMEPFEWELEAINKERSKTEEELAVELFSKFKMERGVYFPTHNVAGQLGAISFSGMRSRLQSDELATLHLISLYAYSRLALVLSDPNGKRIELTAKEKEGLLWAAEGKTNSEIAAILSIAESTVASRFNSICQKLSACNKTHAVAKAIKAGLLK